MIVRNKDQLCLLCRTRKADATGSHFAPAGLIKHTVGERNYEEAYSIDPHEPSIKTHFGRSNLKNTDPVPTHNHHVADYIFCKQCENNLSKFENAIIPFLNKEVFDQAKHIGFKATQLSVDAKLLESSRVDTNVFITFFYSVIWRLCLHQRLDYGTILISVDFEEELRLFLNRYININIQDLKKIDIEFPFSLVLLTHSVSDKEAATFINPNIDLTNPYLFYMGPVAGLIYHEACAVTSKVAGLPEYLVQRSLANNSGKEAVKIIDLSKEVWTALNEEIVKYSSKRYLKSMVENLARQRRITLNNAAEILNQKTDELLNSGQEYDWADAARAAFEQEMKISC